MRRVFKCDRPFPHCSPRHVPCFRTNADNNAVPLLLRTVVVRLVVSAYRGFFPYRTKEFDGLASDTPLQLLFWMTKAVRWRISHLAMISLPSSGKDFGRNEGGCVERTAHAGDSAETDAE